MLDRVAAWLSGLPTALGVVAGLLGGGTLSALGLLMAHRLLPHRVRTAHNDVSGFVLTIVGTIYAVLLAFIAVAVWQSFGQADSLVQTEANLVSDLYRDTVVFPPPIATQLRDALYVYSETVIQDEWPALATGKADQAPGWQLLDRFHTQLARIRTDTPTVTAEQTDMVRTLNLLYDARRGRFHAATADLPGILWWTLIVGAAVLMAFTYLFGVPHLFMHVSMVFLLGALIGLVLVLIVSLSNPYRGRNHVSVEPFNTLVRSVEAREFPRN